MQPRQRYLLSIFSTTTFAWWCGLCCSETSPFLAEVARLVSGVRLRAGAGKPYLDTTPFQVTTGPSLVIPIKSPNAGVLALCCLVTGESTQTTGAAPKPGQGHA